MCHSRNINIQIEIYIFFVSGAYEFTEEEKEKLRNGETIHVVSFSKKTNAPFDADVRYGEYEYQGKKRKGIILLKNKGKK